MGVLLLVFVGLNQGLWLEKVAVASAYAVVCELYIFSFTMVMGSIAVFSIIQLQKGPLSLQELEKKMGNQNAAQGRLESMKKVGLVMEKEGRNALTLKGKILAIFFEKLHSFFFP